MSHFVKTCQKNFYNKKDLQVRFCKPKGLFYSSVCKPGSVLNGHQSLPTVTDRLPCSRKVPPKNILRTSGKLLFGCCSE